MLTALTLRNPLRAITIVGLLCGAGTACGSSPPPTDPGPIGPSAPPPLMACAGDASVVGLGPTQTLTYAAPTVTGGVAPVTVTCTPASGSAFPVGTTTVSCVATDAAAQTATCSLSARVTAPQLGAKKFQTAGDSLTQGETGPPFQVNVIDIPNAYPTKLNALLQSAFPGQGIVVSNRGAGGRTVNQLKDQLPIDLALDRPEVVILLAGYNDLTIPCHAGITVSDLGCDFAVEFVDDTLRECVQIVKRSASVRYVFISTLTPSGPLTPNTTKDNRIDLSAIQAVNARIRTIAALEGVTLIDAYPAFVGREAEFVSGDGLHLRPAGYQALADLFFARILATIPRSQPGVFYAR